MEKYIVKLENGVYLSSHEGDPPRTLKKRNARVFNAEKQAKSAMKKAQKYRPFLDAEIIKL